jgi:ATP-dependent exoDNAse (exonuclease V) alpha subunit
VVVCDEASMLGTPDLARLVVLVERADPKLVLVGDHHQLGAVEAGGLFRLLTADAKTAELTTIRRFTEPWESDASRRLRDQDQSIIAECEARDRVRAGDRDQVVGVGDEIVTTLNHRRLMTSVGGWVRNGDRWQILARHRDNSPLLSSLDGRGRVTLSAHYVAENVTLAYAVTIRKSEGLTVDEAVVIVDAATAAEHLYVGMTRGRNNNLACVVCEPLDDDHQHRQVPDAPTCTDDARAGPL